LENLFFIYIQKTKALKIYIKNQLLTPGMSLAFLSIRLIQKPQGRKETIMYASNVAVKQTFHLHSNISEMVTEAAEKSSSKKYREGLKIALVLIPSSLVTGILVKNVWAIAISLLSF
jgi:hypothetical protein